MTCAHLLVTAAVFSLASAAATVPAQSEPDMDRDELATGAFSRMHMLYERTIFNVDVLTLEMRFDQPTQRTFREMARGRSYTDDLAERIATAAVDAENVFLEVRFERGVGLDRWVDGVRENLRMARVWGLIDETTYRHVSEQLPHWFRSIAERGFREGDRILYRAYPDRLRTVLKRIQPNVRLTLVDRRSPDLQAVLQIDLNKAETLVRRPAAIAGCHHREGSARARSGAPRLARADDGRVPVGVGGTTAIHGAGCSPASRCSRCCSRWSVSTA